MGRRARAVFTDFEAYPAFARLTGNRLPYAIYKLAAPRSLAREFVPSRDSTRRTAVERILFQVRAERGIRSTRRPRTDVAHPRQRQFWVFGTLCGSSMTPHGVSATEVGPPARVRCRPRQLPPLVLPLKTWVSDGRLPSACELPQLLPGAQPRRRGLVAHADFTTYPHELLKRRNFTSMDVPVIGISRWGETKRVAANPLVATRVF